MERSSAWAGGRFRNRFPTRMMQPGRNGATIAKFLLESGEREPPTPLPTAAVDVAALYELPAEGVRATWMGHSTVYVEIEGVRVLCDPIWSERASPTRIAGPRRFQPPPVALEALPDPDVVVISHDHYDHLNRPTVEALARGRARFVVPLRVGEVLESWGIDPERIVELDWWEQAEVVRGRLAIAAAPARHFSGRGLTDRNRRLWAAFSLFGQSRRVFFGGDGGFDESFVEIGRRHGPFDLTMLEIGASDPAWADIHLGPANAIVAHRALQGHVLLPIHWATFNLALHAWYEPGEQVRAAAEGTAIDLALPRIGQTVAVGAALPVEPWWRAARPASERPGAP